MKIDLDAISLSTADLARVLRIDRRTIDKLAVEGVLHRVNHRFELVEAVGANCQYRASSGRDDITKTARIRSLEASASLKATQQKIAEQKLLSDFDAYCLKAHVAQQWAANAHEFQSWAYHDLPPRIRIGLDLTLAQQEQIECIVDQCLTELSARMEPGTLREAAE